jgi:RNA polymerase sigma-70 factor (ECF subfamily)
LPVFKVLRQDFDLAATIERTSGSASMSEQTSFEDLIRRVRAGDQDAAAELVQRYEPAIRRAVRFRLSDTRLMRVLDSMDICQSVFASFFVRTANGQFDIDNPEQLMKLLVAMARNKLAKQVHGQQRQCRDYRRVQGGEMDEGQFPAAEGTPSQFAAGQELLREADKLLTEEEIKLRELRKEGFDWSAIAQQLGSSPEALRKKLTRALDRVAHELKLDDYEHE